MSARGPISTAPPKGRIPSGSTTPAAMRPTGASRARATLADIGERPASRRDTLSPGTPSSRRTARARRASVPSIGDRVLGIGILIFLLYAALACRLFYLQIVRNREFKQTAERLRIKEVYIPARRGDLLDRKGMLLVRNEPAVDVILDPNLWNVNVNPKIGETVEARRTRVLAALGTLLPGIDVAGMLQKDEAKRDAHGRYRTLTLAQRQDPELGQKIRSANLMGVGALPSFRRVAIDGGLAPHVLGFTGRDGKGLDGLEERLDAPLTGARGEEKAEFDTRGAIPGTITTEKPVQNGRDIVLTLDSTLQNEVQTILQNAFTYRQAEAATAVVLDPKTGEILACANCPTFNVNDRGATPPAARVDRAVSTPYEPGSTLKLITVAAALEEKVVTPQSRFECNGSMAVGNKTIHCHLDNAFPHGHGDESLVDVIKNSCNVATAKCAMQLGKEKLYRYETAFGFGQKTGAGLPGESRGRLTPPSTWSQIQFANVAFGQGISVTPLQIAAAYAAIADDGVYHRPHIVWGDRNPQTMQLEADKPDDPRRVISAATAAELKSMLQEVVEHGTGKNAQLEGYTAGGKTGTAQIAEGGSYKNGKFVASFIGMAPMTNPQFVILVAITDPKKGHFGAEVSAPVFKEIAEKALLERRVPMDKAPAASLSSGTGVSPHVTLRDD